MSRSDADAIELRDGASRALVAVRGAELRAWSVAGHDILWTPDPASWDAVAPILFPVVGWTRGGSVRVDGKTYPLGLHGFASRRRFAIAGNDGTRLRLTDRADADTLGLYPFDYRLTVDVALQGASLSCVAQVSNEGDRPMPYAFGLHPGFRWPPDALASVTFDEPEDPFVPVITAYGLFAPERRSIPLEGREIALTRELVAHEALCFLDLRSSALTFEAQDFGRLRIEHEDFPHAAVWSRTPAPFLCVESWTGHGDPDGFEGELSDKPSMRILAPGASARHAARYTFSPPS